MNTKSAHPPWEAVVAVALVSASILATEVALTRVFSVLFRAPYVFLILSGAVGGLGLGGLLVQSLQLDEARTRRWIVGLSVVLAAALAAPVLLLFVSPWGRDLVSQAETAVVVALPMATFCVAGALLSLILRCYSAAGGFLYFVDLGAAALAAPASVLLLDRLGGLNTPILLAAAASVVGLVLSLRARLRAAALAAAAAALAFAGVLGSNLARPWIALPPLQMPSAAVTDGSHMWHFITKPLFAELADPSASSEIVRTDWTAVSRTDVVYAPGSETYYIYTDGDVPTQMYPWDGNLERSRREYGAFIGALPYRLASARPESVLAIGSGGGLDVLLALCAGARSVDAVEINPSIPAIAADPRFDHTYARVYREPGVRLLVDEGRSFLQRAGRYDLIYFACAKTATTQTSGVALLDNHLYTVEAFRDYWRHLKENGAAALVTQESFLIDRLLITALAALRQEGIPETEAARHLLTARLPPQRFGEGPYRHLLMMRRQAWQPDEMAGVAATIEQGGLEPLYLPHVKPEGAQGGRFDPAAPAGEIQAALERQYDIPADATRPEGPSVKASLSPVTDDRPFYVDIARGLHPTLVRLLTGAGIGMLLVLAAAAACGIFVLRRQPGREGESGAGASSGGGARLVRALLYFSMLGAGFMLVELALMQRLNLLLGFPTLSLTVTLFALLLSSAFGSMVSQGGTPLAAARRQRRVLPLLGALLAVYCFFLPPVVERLLPLPFAVRAAAAVVLLFPAGFLMGMPFPTALRCLDGPFARLIPAFWSVNGAASILGSVATMAIAKSAGYGSALLLGMACYALAWGSFPGPPGHSDGETTGSTASTVSPT